MLRHGRVMRNPYRMHAMYISQIPGHGAEACATQSTAPVGFACLAFSNLLTTAPEHEHSLCERAQLALQTQFMVHVLFPCCSFSRNELLFLNQP